MNQTKTSPRYLTKSRFKLGLDCPTALYYTNKPDEYADNSKNDPFLMALAEGGFQVGELAKFLFCDNPVKENITIEDREYDIALQKTNERLKNNCVIAEAAVLHENLFIRIDILVKENNHLRIYEVKAKSWGAGDDFWKKTKGGDLMIEKKWAPYLYDISFQKHVVKKAFPGYTVSAHLVLVDKESASSIEGLNQIFRINSDRNVVVAEDMSRSSLGIIPLKIINVDIECEWINNNPIQVDLEGDRGFVDIVELFSEKYRIDERIWSRLGSKCRDCQFQPSDEKLKSGFEECWKHLARFSDEDFKKPLTLELWGGLAGNKSLVQEIIKKGKFFLSQIEDNDYFPKSAARAYDGLSPSERRKIQIERRVNNGDKYLDKARLEKIFDSLEKPFHFIDFETSAVALPFHKGRTPYETVTFQYSYHLMSETGAIEHKSEYINLENGFPNYDFVRSLRADLLGKKGTIFRYHNHENTCLSAIYAQLLEEDDSVVPDKKDLIEFIRDITHGNIEGVGEWDGINDMVDLWKLVLSYYYSPSAKGFNSIKAILPSIIEHSTYIKEKYSEPIYGTREIPSKNFREHRWIVESAGFNPYNTLPKVLKEYDNDVLDSYGINIEDLKDGGAAMMAYAYSQFTDLGKKQKDEIKKALLRYCELDTMAMVMIWEYWGKEIGFF